MNAVIAVGIIVVVLAATVALGIFGVRRVHMSPEQYIVGGRSFGALFLWLLLAGEVYTSFTFLGAAGWAYGRGAPAFYILCYGTLAFILSYYLLPPIWRRARAHGYLTGPDFFAHQYQSRGLGALVAIVGFIFLVPYATLQLTGVQILLTIAGYGGITGFTAVGVAFALIVIFVFATGLRGAAWASVVKDVLVVVAVIFAGIFLPIHFFGSPAGAIDRVLALHPNWFTLAGDTSSSGIVWFLSTVILTALGFSMWPHAMAATYSAKSEDVLRRNAVALPIYQGMIALVYFAGYTALVLIPGLKGGAADQSFMLVVQKFYSPWVLGSVAAAGCLAGLVPASVQILAAASIVSKNVIGDALGIAKSDAAQTRTTRILVLVVATLAFVVWAYAKTTLVDLLLIAYNGIAQFFPGVILVLVGRAPRPFAVGAGIVTGIATLAVCAALGVSTVVGVNVGLIALALNSAVCGVIALASPRRRHIGSDAVDTQSSVETEPLMP